MLQFTLQFLVLLSGCRCILVFLSLEFWGCDVGLLSCLRGWKLEPSFKDRFSWSYSLFSAWNFKNISLWRSIRRTFQDQHTKYYASSTESIETSLYTYHLTKTKWSKPPLSFGSTFRRWPASSSLWKPSSNVSIKSTNFGDERTSSVPLSILSHIIAAALAKYESGS